MTSIYEIRILGSVGQDWSRWFSNCEITVERLESGPPQTKIRCPTPDQAMLRGIANKVWDMNLEIISIRRLADPPVEKFSAAENHQA